MSDCIFCSIVRGEEPASRVYEDTDTLAFMNQRQLNAGHVLVIPKKHFESIDQLPLEVAGALFQTAVIVANALKTTFHPAGMSVWQSNGTAAGQEVFHVHIHLFPRQPEDGFAAFHYESTPPVLERSQLDKLAEQIRQNVPAASSMPSTGS